MDDPRKDHEYVTADQWLYHEGEDSLGILAMVGQVHKAMWKGCELHKHEE